MLGSRKWMKKRLAGLSSAGLSIAARMVELKLARKQRQNALADADNTLWWRAPTRPNHEHRCLF
jgi:hypothetical protein